MERGPEFSEPEANLASKKKRSNKNNMDKNHQRRFSDEQIRLLESMFESDTKLEPTKKVQIARELGLQPRQVAIWFQNRRARWKSKQIEQAFTILRAQYESLTNQFESLKRERQSLISQLEKLNNLLGSSSGNITNSTSEVKHSLLQEGLENDRGAMQMQPRDDNYTTNDIVGDLKQEGITGSYDQLQNTSQEGDQDHASLASLESWYRSLDVFDQPRGCSQWLNF